ncbi:tumor necrosis factor alpha-induced protein 2-like [Chaetodon trifascialis]|uniref:tumor necrosis factor alpha-induced protein 2-like n=1 Tax=Chaetodon trifascialis TaxID=109706 RepID=UPI0039925B27
MRLRSDSTEMDGLRSNHPPDQSGRPAAGRRFKLPKIWGGQRGQAGVNNTPAAVDGRHSPREEQPQSVTLTFEQILKARHLCEASRLLIEREERLFRDIKETEALTQNQEKVDRLAEDYRQLEDLVLRSLSLSLTQDEVSMGAVTSAVTAIIQEMKQDQQWKQRPETMPPWRPCGWKKLHDVTLRNLVEQRMDNPSTPPADQQQGSSIRTDIERMGIQLKEDLLVVVDTVRSCYPPEMDICNFYARLYHQYLSARLRKIAEFGLGDKDCTYLLRWVNEYYPQILQKAELVGEIDAEALGKLLPKESLEPLEEQYLSKQQDELTTFIGRVLEEAKQKFDEGEEPTREDGCFDSPLAYDIIQLINGMVTSAETIVGDRQKAQNITCKLKDLMQRFSSFQSNVVKQNKPNSRPFIKANLGCIEQFSDVLHKKSHLFPKQVQEDCLLILVEMEKSARTYLLKPVHENLKHHYRKLGTSDWLNKDLFEKLLVSIEQQLQDLQGSIEACHQKLIGQLHQEVTAEYVKRLLKGNVRLKNRELQLKAYTTIKDNAESLQELFGNTGSKELWLRDVLTMIAEVLKLQDLPAIQMHIASLGASYPDLTEKHVSALLKLKTDFTKANRKTVKDTLLDCRDSKNTDAQPFFSTVHVK